MSETICKIIHHKIETPIEMDPHVPKVLAIESPKEFYALVEELGAQFEGEDGNFVLLDGENRLSFEKNGEFVRDIFSLNFEDKKLTSSLYKNLEKISADGELQVLQNKLDTELALYYSSLFDRLSLSLTFDEMCVSDILKLGKVRLQEYYSGILEKIICYINAMIELKKSRFFVFVHLKSVLTDDELKQLYRHCALEKVGLLLMESGIKRGVLREERTLIITEDLCEIVDKSPD